MERNVEMKEGHGDKRKRTAEETITSNVTREPKRTQLITDKVFTTTFPSLDVIQKAARGDKPSMNVIQGLGNPELCSMLQSRTGLNFKKHKLSKKQLIMRLFKVFSGDKSVDLNPGIPQGGDAVVDKAPCQPILPDLNGTYHTSHDEGGDNPSSQGEEETISVREQSREKVCVPVEATIDASLAFQKQQGEHVDGHALVNLKTSNCSVEAEAQNTNPPPQLNGACEKPCGEGESIPSEHQRTTEQVPMCTSLFTSDIILELVEKGGESSASQAGTKKGGAHLSQSLECKAVQQYTVKEAWSSRLCNNRKCGAIVEPDHTFCHQCTCFICLKSNNDGSVQNIQVSLLSCPSESCTFRCHIQCAQSKELAGVILNQSQAQHNRHPIPLLDAEYLCQQCGHVGSLIETLKRLLDAARTTTYIETLRTNLQVAYDLLVGSRRLQKVAIIVEDLVDALEEGIGPLSLQLGAAISEKVQQIPSAGQVQQMLARLMQFMANCNEEELGFSGKNAEQELRLEAVNDGSKKAINSECLECGNTGDLLHCETWQCSSAYHAKCVGLNQAPSSRWLCPRCRTARHIKYELITCKHTFSPRVLSISGKARRRPLKMICKYCGIGPPGAPTSRREALSKCASSPPVPSSISFSDIKMSSLTLHWEVAEMNTHDITQPGGIITNFMLTMQKKGPGSSAQGTSLLLPKCPPVRVTGLEPGTTYVFSVAAVMDSGKLGEESLRMSCTTLPSQDGESPENSGGAEEMDTHDEVAAATRDAQVLLSLHPAVHGDTNASSAPKEQAVATCSQLNGDKSQLQVKLSLSRELGASPSGVGDLNCSLPSRSDHRAVVDETFPDTDAAGAEGGEGKGRQVAVSWGLKSSTTNAAESHGMAVAADKEATGPGKDIPAAAGASSGALDRAGSSAQQLPGSMEPSYAQTCGSLEEYSNAGQVGPTLNKVQGQKQHVIRTVCSLERQNLLQRDFRKKFLTWFLRRASQDEKDTVLLYMNEIKDDPSVLADQLIDTFIQAVDSTSN